MATSINKGSQYISFDFKHPAKGADFDRLLRDVIKPGIYKGLTLTNPSANIVDIAVGSLWMNAYDANNLVDNLAIHAEMQTVVTETINQTTGGQNEVLYLYYEYVENTENYFDIRHTNRVDFEATGPANAIVIGDITYDGGGNITGFDYSSRTWGTFSVEAGYSFNSSTPFSDVTDYTKKVLIDPSSITTATTRTLTVADTNMNLDSGPVRTTLENIDSGDIHTTAEGIATGFNAVEGVTVTNAPDTGEYYFEISKVDTNNITVKAIHKTTDTIYIKNKASGVWGSWVALQVSGNYAQLDGNGSVYEAFEAIDISSGDVHVVTRRGPFHGTGLTNAPTQNLFWGNDYIPPDPVGTNYNAMSKVVGDKLWVAGGILSTGLATTAIRYYDFTTKSWTTIGAVLPAARAHSGIAKDGTDLYIICGTDDNNNPATNTIYKIDTLLEFVSTITPTTGTMPSRISAAVSDVITVGGNKIVIIAGGFSGVSPSAETPESTIYWWDLTADAVITKTATLPAARAGASAVTVNDKLYIMGGHTAVATAWYNTSGGTVYDSILAYDPNSVTDDAAATTTFTSTLNSTYAMTMAQEYNGNIYIFGGYSPGAANVYSKFNYTGDSITHYASGMPAYSFSSAYAVYKNSIFLVGGQDGNISFITDLIKQFIIVDDWKIQYEKTNTSSLLVTATDAYNSWWGYARKIASNIDTTPVWYDWIYTDTNTLQWYDITLLNSWVAATHAKFSKDENGWVTISLRAITGGVSTTVGILPVGYRPQLDILKGDYPGASNAYIRIDTSGNIICALATTNAYITFKAET